MFALNINPDHLSNCPSDIQKWSQPRTKATHRPKMGTFCYL